MNEIQEVIQRLASIIKGLRDRGNNVLSNLAPIEQLEGTQHFANVLSHSRYVQSELEAIDTRFAELLTKYPTQLVTYAEKISEEAAQKLLDEKKHVLASESEAHVQLAQKKAKEEAEAEYKETLTRTETRHARRAEVNTELGEGIAEQLSEEVLDAENWATTLATLKDRKTRLAEVKLGPDCTFFSELLTKPLTTEGSAQFDKGVEGLKGYALKLASKPSDAPPRTVPPGNQPSSKTEDSEKTLLIA